MILVFEFKLILNNCLFFIKRLSNSQNFSEIYLRRVEIENFKSFLKENDAFLFYKLWIDIDKLNTTLNENDRIK